MAGVKGRSGGERPRDPFAISATGGAGSKDGQPKRYISGGKYGEGQQLMQQQAGAPMAKAPSPVPATMAVPEGKPLGTLMDETNNVSEPITAGVDFGPGPGSDILPKNISADTRLDENRAIVQKYLPTLLSAANMPDTPDSYKRFVNYLLGKQ